MLSRILILSLFIISSFANEQNVEQQCGPRIRRAWRTLTGQEQQNYAEAVLELKRRGVYDNFSLLHASRFNMNIAHGTSFFLPWHRWHLWQFENAIRSLGGRFACLTVPYWDWERDDASSRRNSALFSNSAPLGSYVSSRNPSCVNSGIIAGWRATSGECLRRQFDSSISIPNDFQVLSALINTRYGDTDQNNPGFRLILEDRLHGSAHSWIGGHMGGIDTSTNDPIFFLHHANVDRLWAIWQDCHDYDKVDYASANPNQRYQWYTYSSSRDRLNSPLPYTYSNGRPETVFQINGRSARPIDVMTITGSPSGMEYRYDSNDNMVHLLDERYRRCRWDWFTPSRSSGGSPRPSTSSPRPSTSSPRSNARQSPTQEFQQNDQFDIFSFFNRGKKRSAEETSAFGMPVVRKYSDAAAGLIDKIKNTFKVHDPRVQALVESICDSNPITKLAPVEEKIWMAAVGECAITETERHVSDSWIRSLGLSENMTKTFEPICPKKSCCNVTEMVNTAMLCPGGGVAVPVCVSQTCTWRYDCANKTIVETTPIVIDEKTTQVTQVAAAWASDEIEFSNYDEEIAAARADQVVTSESALVRASALLLVCLCSLFLFHSL